MYMENEIKEQKDIKNTDIKKKHRWYYYFFNVIIWGFIVLVTGYSALNIIDRKSGYSLPFHNAIILSESMSYVNTSNYYYLDKDVKHINKNDLIFSIKYDSFEDVKRYDIVTYLGESGVLVCHRVMDTYTSEGNNYVVCRGDANSASDTPVNFNRVKGKVVSVTPKVGVVVSFIQSYYFLMAVGFSIFFVCLGLLIAGYGQDKKKEEHIVVEEVKPIEQEEVNKDNEESIKDSPKE